MLELSEIVQNLENIKKYKYCQELKRYSWRYTVIWKRIIHPAKEELKEANRRNHHTLRKRDSECYDS